MVLWLRPWQERNAATLGPLNLHRERERTKGTNRPHICISTTGTDTTTATGEDGRTDSRAAAHPPGRERHEGPERIHPRQHQHSRTAGGQEDRRTTAPREDRQTPSAAKDPQNLDPVKHLDSIDGKRARAQPPRLDLRRT